MLAELTWNYETLKLLLAFSIPIVAIVGGIWYAVERLRVDREMKRDMIRRGMSAEQMQQVLSMKSGHR